MSHVKIGETVVTRYLNLDKLQDTNVIVQTALDGTEYLTRFGRSVTNYKVEVFVTDAQRDMLMAALDRLAEVEIVTRKETVVGRMKSLSEFKRIGYGWYSATFLLATNAEVTP